MNETEVADAATACDKNRFDKKRRHKKECLTGESEQASNSEKEMNRIKSIENSNLRMKNKIFLFQKKIQSKNNFALMWHKPTNRVGYFVSEHFMTI